MPYSTVGQTVVAPNVDYVNRVRSAAAAHGDSGIAWQLTFAGLCPQVSPVNHFCAVVCGILLMATPAAAETGTEEVKRIYDEASTSYNLGEYEKALAGFKEAYRLRHDPALLFNLGQSERLLKQYDAAAKSYRAFLREAEEVSPKTRDDVQRLIGEMEKAAGEEQNAARRQNASGAVPPANEAHAPHQLQPSTEILHFHPAVRPRPVYKRPWFWLTLVGGAAVIATGVAVGIVYGAPGKYPTVDFGHATGN